MQPRTSVSDERVSDAVAQEVLDVEEVLELISLGRFHYQLLIICGTHSLTHSLIQTISILIQTISILIHSYL
jgi:hypothetical protein